MDSFCFTAPPCPTKKPFLEPCVPDASLLMQAPQPNTYQAWRNNFNTGNQSQKVTTSILKKSVRFDSPTAPFEVQRKSNREHDSNQIPVNPQSQFNTPPLNKVLKNKPFQEIYMANIPNRHLDLSLIDINKPGLNSPNRKQENVENKNHIEDVDEVSTPPQKVPTTYREFLEMQKKTKDTNKPNERMETNQVTDIFNYASPKFEQRNRQSYKPVETKASSNNSETQKKHINELKTQKNVYSYITSKGDVMEKENVYCNNVEQHFNQVLEPRNSNDKPHLDKDLKNYGSPTQQMGQKCDTSVQTSIIKYTNEQVKEKQVQTVQTKETEEPTVKDLLKIIQQQNEQLLVLQKQVASLLDFKESQKCIEPPKQEERFVQPRKDHLNSAGSTPRKGPMPKFSIDLMTSFEVSFRPQQNMYQRKQRDFIGQEPKIREIVETDVADTNLETMKGRADPSLYLQNPITVQENCPSPEPSINIDMKDYESSDDDDDSTSEIGASFYRKMMDQVNKIIQNAQRQATIDGRTSGTEELRERTLTKVRDATIKQLKKINMNFSPIEEVSTSNCSDISDETSEQINSAVKQLLMKYLPDEQLSKFHRENNEVRNKKQSTEKIVLNARAPQFSFATVQFMKKYDLIAGEDTPKMPDMRERANVPRPYRGQQNNPKILDISTLKQQPKLL